MSIFRKYSSKGWCRNPGPRRSRSLESSTTSFVSWKKDNGVEKVHAAWGEGLRNQAWKKCISFLPILYWPECDYIASFICKYAGKCSLSWGPRKRKKFVEYTVVSLLHLGTGENEMCTHRVVRSLFGCRKLVKLVRGLGGSRRGHWMPKLRS